MTAGDGRDDHADPARSRLRAAGVVAALAAIAAATLTPQSPLVQLMPWYLPFPGAGDGADALLNVALFVPLGIALGVARVTRRRSMAIALATTITVELLQGFVVPGRQASISDVITNTLGGWLGHVVAFAAVSAARADTGRARRLATGYAAIWLAGTLAAAALLAPALPVAAAYSARCGPGDLPDCAPGRLASPLLLRQPGRPDGDVVQGATFVVGVDAMLVADIVDGGRAWRPGRIGGLVTSSERALMTLEQGDDWLLFVARTRGANYGLRTPAVGLRGTFGRAGRRIEARAGVTGTLRWLAVDDRRAELRLSPADGWRLFFPWSAASATIVVTVGAFFHGIMLLPLGFWAARAAGEGGWRAAVAAAVASALLMSLAFAGGWLAFGLGAPHAADLGGGIVGALAGAALAGRVGRRRSANDEAATNDRDAGPRARPRRAGLTAILQRASFSA